MDKILARTKQSVANEFPSMAAVLVMPSMLIILSHRKEGIVLGLLFLAFFIYGMVLIYNKLYRKTLTFTEKNIIFKNKEFSKIETKVIEYKELKIFQIKRNLLNNLTDTGKIILKTDDYELDMVNVIKPQELKTIIETKTSKRF